MRPRLALLILAAAALVWPLSEKNCESGSSMAPAIFESVSSEGMVWPFSTRER